MLTNIPPLDVLGPYLTLIEKLSFSLPQIDNSLSAKQFFDWNPSSTLLIFEQFDYYNKTLENILTNGYESSMLVMSNILAKIVEDNDFKNKWFSWYNLLEDKINLLSTTQIFTDWSSQFESEFNSLINMNILNQSENFANLEKALTSLIIGKSDKTLNNI
jgi:hypothetical protein